jgi:hypothetical protein
VPRRRSVTQSLAASLSTSLTSCQRFPHISSVYRTRLGTPKHFVLTATEIRSVVQTHTASPQASDYLHLHLSTPVNSSTSKAGSKSRPLFRSRTTRRITNCSIPPGPESPGRSRKPPLRGGRRETEASCLHSAPSRCRRARREISIQLSEAFKPSVRKVWTSVRRAKLKLRLRLSRLLAVVSLVGPSRAVADTTLQKTPWPRSGEGRKGFGLLGAGAAQACRHGNWVGILWRRKETLRCIHH